MSVRVSERSEGKLQVLKLSKDLAAYTFAVCGNSKNFPKHTRFTIVDKMVNTSIDIMSCIADANGLPLTEEFIAERRKLQHKALMLLKRMYTLIDFAYSVLPNMSSDRFEHWGLSVKNVITALRAWIKSDAERLK